MDGNEVRRARKISRHFIDDDVRLTLRELQRIDRERVNPAPDRSHFVDLTICSCIFLDISLLNSRNTMARVYIEELKGHVGESVTVKGWVYNKRSSGKIRFVIVRDGTGILQCVMVKGCPRRNLLPVR